MKLSTLAFGLVAAFGAPAVAQIDVIFDEGAPKDRFIVTNASACAMPEGELTIDLNGSAGGLVFDVTGAGAGVEVFQPFEVVAGAAELSAVPTVVDGDRAVTLGISSLAPGASIAFTIDVDDTIGTRAITVSNSEISGATAVWQSAGTQTDAAFTDAARVQLPLAGCSS